MSWFVMFLRDSILHGYSLVLYISEKIQIQKLLTIYFRLQANFKHSLHNNMLVAYIGVKLICLMGGQTSKLIGKYAFTNRTWFVQSAH